MEIRLKNGEIHDERFYFMEIDLSNDEIINLIKGKFPVIPLKITEDLLNKELIVSVGTSIK